MTQRTRDTATLALESVFKADSPWAHASAVRALFYALADDAAEAAAMMDADQNARPWDRVANHLRKVAERFDAKPGEVPEKVYGSLYR
jgi:hypothetical protein